MVSWWVGRFQIGNFQPLCLKFPVENARPRAVQSHESARREATRRVSLREAEADKVRDALLAAVAKTGQERKAQPEKKRKDANPKA